MKALIFTLCFVFTLFAAGGDTLHYSSEVENLSDGDNFYADIHWKSLKDSIASIVNGKLGNLNIASDAEIDLSKLDTVGILKSDTTRSKKTTTDTANIIRRLSAPIALIDSAKLRHTNSDSATIPVFKGTEAHRDSAYFASGLRTLRLYTSQAKIDSLVGPLSLTNKLRITGSTNSSPALNIENDFTSSSFQWTPNTDEGLCILTGRGQTPKSYATLLLANSKPDTVEPLGYLGFGHPTTSKSGNIPGWKAYIGLNAVGSGGSVGGYGGEMSFFTRGDNASDLSEAMRITSTQNVGIGTTSPTERLSVSGNVTASGFIGPLTGNVTGNVSGSSGAFSDNVSIDDTLKVGTSASRQVKIYNGWYRDTTTSTGVVYGFTPTYPTPTIRTIQIGKIVTATLSAFTGTSNGSNYFGGGYNSAAPAVPSNTKIPLSSNIVTDNGSVTTQGCYIDLRTNGAFYILKDDNSVFSGTTGLSQPITFTYVVN